MPEFLSHSQLQTLKDCGEQYRLKYVEHAEARPYTAMVGGTMTHAGTEQIDVQILAGVTDPEQLFTAGHAMAMGALEHELEQVAKRSPNYTDPSTWIVDGRGRSKAGQNLEWYKTVALVNGLHNYIDWRLNRQPDLVPMEIEGFGPAIEYPFELKLGSRIVRGKIDRIFWHRVTKVPLIVDLKNGGKPKNHSQLGIYSLAMRQRFPEGYWRWGAYVYGLKYNTQPDKKSAPQMHESLPVDLDYWTEARVKASNRFAVMVMDHGYFIPNPGDQCERCPFAHLCDYAAATSI